MKIVSCHINGRTSTKEKMGLDDIFKSSNLGVNQSISFSFNGKLGKYTGILTQKGHEKKLYTLRILSPSSKTGRKDVFSYKSFSLEQVKDKVKDLFDNVGFTSKEIKSKSSYDSLDYDLNGETI